MPDITDPPEDERLALDIRREQRLAALPALLRRNDERMALELVMLSAGQDPWKVFESYGYSQPEALERLQHPAFAKLLAAARKDIQENGAGFVAKARVQAEQYLQEVDDIVTDPLCSSSVRADLIKWTAAVAGYGPKKDDKNSGGSGGGLALNITFTGVAPAPIVVQAEPLTLEG